MPVCLGCNASFGDNFQFCPHCGRARSDTPKANVNLNVAIEGGVNSCPICRTNQRVEKATAILKSQTRQTEGEMPVEMVRTDNEGRVRSSTEYRSYSATQSSDLAKLLTPPQRPTSDKYGCCIAYFAFQMVGAGFMALFGIFGGCLFLLGAPAIAFSENTVSEGSPVVSAVFTALMGIGVIVGSVLIFLLFFAGFRHFRKLRSDDQRRIDQTTGAEWQRAMSRWENLYYCYRCDCIFVPGEKPTSAGNMMNYIYGVR